MDWLNGPPVRVHPFFGYRSRTRLLLSARALRSGSPRFDKAGRIRAMRTMLSQFASREAPGVRVRLELPGAGETLVHAEATTDNDGFVHFDLPLDPPLSLPAHPAWEGAVLRWTNRLGEQSTNAHVLAPGTDGELAVISDIDDTIMETGITGGLRSIARNWRRVVAQLPDERIAVPGADVFYGSLGGGEVPGPNQPQPAKPATHRPFFYVSSSPWNLFAYLVAYKRSKGLPLGPMLLRNWGLNRATLGSSGHGAHKRDSIDGILAMYPELRFVLIGDDTQGDLPAYASAAQRYPGRVAAIFIRTVASKPLSNNEQEARAMIEGAGVPLWLGENWEIGKDFLRALGFTPGGETEQIVRVVEKVPTAAEGG